MKIEIEKHTGGFVFKYTVAGKEVVAVCSGGNRGLFKRLREILKEIGAKTPEQKISTKTSLK
jgi:hypothetical protein